VQLATVIVVAAVAAGAFILSYAGVHAIALQAGVSASLARFYPAVFDAVLVIACAAAPLRGARWWTRFYTWAVIVLVVGALGAMDALHAMSVSVPHRALAGVISVVPWALLLLGFGLWLAIVRHYRRQAAVQALAEADGPAMSPVPLGPLARPALPAAAAPPATEALPPAAALPPAEVVPAAEVVPGQPADDAPRSTGTAPGPEAVTGRRAASEANEAATASAEAARAKTPAENVPVRPVTARTGHARELPAGSAPARPTANQDAPGQDAPGQEAPGQEAPGQEAANQDAPAAGTNPAPAGSGAAGTVPGTAAPGSTAPGAAIPGAAMPGGSAPAGSAQDPAARPADSGEEPAPAELAEVPGVTYSTGPRLRRVRSLPAPPVDDELCPGLEGLGEASPGPGLEPQRAARPVLGVPYQDLAVAVGGGLDAVAALRP
jgi:hypothetical protein